MIVSDEVRKCVAFVGIQKADGTACLVGSGFFLGSNTREGKVDAVRFVTARHVIDGVRRLGLTEVLIRVNQKRGDAAWVKTELSQWIFHPNDTSIDVAVFPCGLPEGVDHLIIPFSLGATEQRLKEHEIGLGDEVFITGLFRHHHGSRRNVPIVRVGNVACLGEEKIVTKDYGEIDAYLIEARSIGGLSGSPVFLNLGIVRRIQGQMRVAEGGPIFLLFGLIHGHFDSKASLIDHDHDQPDADQSLTNERVNTGIAIVVPFQRIEEVFLLSKPIGQSG